MNHNLLPALIVVLILISLVPSFLPLTKSDESKPLYVILIWHYHQPWYYDSNESAFILPWVRMHTVGNYYKMATILSKYPEVKATFTFSGSLLQQIKAYNNGMKDLREITSWKIAHNESLTIDEKFNMLQIPGGFFDISWKRVVEVVPRFKALRDKAVEALDKYKDLPEDEYKASVVNEFSEQDFIDLAVLFNLFWMDPSVTEEEYPDIYKMRMKASGNPNAQFTRDNLSRILEAHTEIMSKVLSKYSQLASSGQAELIPVPYSHPLAPILTDFGWSEDLDMHVARGIKLFKDSFGYMPAGVWPAEQAVNDYVLREFSKNFTWTVTDKDILKKSGIDTSNRSTIMKPWYRTFDGRKIYVFFRNTELSNLISFTYSNWVATNAVTDLMNRLLSLREMSDGKSVVVIALDGENPWENYDEFGDLFLNKLYSTLKEYQDEGSIITITPKEYIEMFSDEAQAIPVGQREYLDLMGKDISDTPVSYLEDGYGSLPRKVVEAGLAEGSWAGGELTIWIGQRQENAAWMLLAKARSDLLKTLNVDTLQEVAELKPKAVEYLLRAEASDWFWWYGGDGGGTFPANPLFKTYLRRIYEEIGVSPPPYLKTTFNPDATPVGTINGESPRPIETPPQIDGVFDAGEWKESMNMSVGNEYVKSIYLSVDPEAAYLAVVPANRTIMTNESVTIGVYFTNPWRSVSPYHPQFNSMPRIRGKDLGMGLFYEVLIKPAEGEAVVRIALGDNTWMNIFTIRDIKVGEVIELKVPWNFLNLKGGELVYVTAAVFNDSDQVEEATRLGNTYLLNVPTPTGGVSGKTVFEMDDPQGDDKGLGTYVYPTNDVFKPGVFDLTHYSVTDAGNKLVFMVKVKDLGGNPWSGPNGFCLQYVQIYVHTGPNATYVSTKTYGLNITISEDSAWSFALLLAPGWGSDPVPEGQRSALYYANNTAVVQDGELKVYADPTQNAIIAEVSKDLLPGIDNLGNWSYVVALTSYDGYGAMKIRPFGVEAAEWVVGVGTEHAQAIVLNVIPRVMDLLAPTAEEQYAMLSSYVIDKESGIVKEAVVKAYGPGTAAPPTETVTTTITYTTTETQTMTETKTVTHTETQTSTETYTETKTMWKTTTTTYISTVPSAAPGIGGVTLAAVAIVGFLIGMVLIYALFKKGMLK